MRRMLTFVAGAVLIAAAAAEPDQVKQDEQTLKESKIAADEQSLLNFFRERTLTDVQRDQIAALIARMGDDSFDVREEATAELMKRGGSAVGPLRQAADSRDLPVEIARRAQRCLELLKAPGVGAIQAAARTLGRRKPASAAAVLLAYLPFGDDEATREAVSSALAMLAIRDGQPDHDILAALDDQVPLRRGVAGEALVRAGAGEQRQPARKLLNDPDAMVRLRVARGFAEGKEKEAIPVLITLLTECPAEHAWQAEDILCRLAGEQGPNVPLGSDAAARKKCRDAWAGWWTKNAATADLGRLTNARQLLGYTLSVEINIRNGQGQVVERGPDGKVRWQIDGLGYPVDAQVVRGDRVLIAEYNGQRVSERNFKGEILWQRQIQNPTACQRLANGNTFIASRNQLLIVDAGNKQVFHHPRPSNDIMTARPLRNGQIVLIANGGQAIHLDANGKQLRTFHVNYNHQFGGIDVLPNGHLLVPQINLGKVIEYDRDGKVVWSADALNPTSAQRLPNGNTLIASFNHSRLFELDRAGKKIWDFQPEARPWKASRR